VKRAATKVVAEEIGALEVVGDFGGKGSTLAEGLLYSGDPAHYKKELAEIAAVTPAEVKAAMNAWLGRPVARLAVVPGERTEKGETMGGWGDEPPRPSRARSAQARAPVAKAPPRSARLWRRWARWPSRRLIMPRFPTASRYAGAPHRRAARAGERGLRCRDRGRCAQHAGHAGADAGAAG
jgi:hypothetical protein